MATIATHAHIDLDAALSTWLVTRFVQSPDGVWDVAFVDRNANLDDFDAVVDIGNVLDPSTLRFDHHQFTGSNATHSASSLVFEFLCDLYADDAFITVLAPLVDLVTDEDLGKRTHDVIQSRNVGLRGVFSAQRYALNFDDAALFAWVCNVFDGLHSAAVARYDAICNLKQHLVYDTKLVVAVERSSKAVTDAAQEAFPNAHFVVYEGDPIKTDKGTLYPFGIMRTATGSASGLHIQHFINTARSISPDAQWARCLEGVFCHNDGWGMINGSAKAQKPRDFAPLGMDIADFANDVHNAYVAYLANGGSQ